jgi:RND family efflux transporter MFP subunit
MNLFPVSKVLQRSLITFSVLFCAACGDDEPQNSEEPVRGVRLFEIEQSASTVKRRYPSLIEPANESRLSFEISGQLGEVTLEEGQQVQAGDLLMRLDDTSLQLELQEAKAAREQADVVLKNAQIDFERKSELLKNGNVTRASFDESETNLRTAQSQQIQSSRRYDIAFERLNKSELRAPFAGVIANVEGRSFTNVTAGGTVLTLYSQSAYEVDFNVPATVINLLSLGANVEVAITDLPGTTLSGKIQEISSRASQVSAFPVVVALTETVAGLKAGMAADVIVSFALPDAAAGFLVPLSCFDFENSEGLGNRRNDVKQFEESNPARVYVFDAASSTVKTRVVQVIGVRDNMLIVSEGLAAGDLVASAGVSYLYDGQMVRPLVPEQE